MSNFRKRTTKRLLAILTLLLQAVGLTTATAQGMDSGACGGRDTVVSIFFAHDRYFLGNEGARLDSVARLLSSRPTTKVALPKAIFTPPTAPNPTPDSIASDSIITDSIAPDSAAHSSLFTLHSSFSCPRLALRTNLLYDLALVPNIGVEWLANDRWSVALNVMYIWARNDMRHRYWRVFSTDVEARYWLRPQPCDVRTGHHFGLYAAFYRYDFEFGGRGWMGDANYGGGLSYGYAVRLFPKWRERFTLDMSIGLGYLGGTHKEYIPDAGCYVWQRTMRHHLFIPTKAEATLVWYPRWRLFNKKKGGAQ